MYDKKGIYKNTVLTLHVYEYTRSKKRISKQRKRQKQLFFVDNCVKMII